MYNNILMFPSENGLFRKEGYQNGHNNNDQNFDPVVFNDEWLDMVERIFFKVVPITAEESIGELSDHRINLGRVETTIVIRIKRTENEINGCFVRFLVSFTVLLDHLFDNLLERDNSVLVKVSRL